MKQNLLRKIIGGLSFASVLFVFQACYGTPQDFGLDVLIEGQVKSKASGEPIKGIKISIENEGQNQLSDDNGQFSFYTVAANSYNLQFSDIDSLQNGYFEKKDTAIAHVNEKIFLEIELDPR